MDETELADSSLSGSLSDLALERALDLALPAALLFGTGLKFRDEAFLGGFGDSPTRDRELLAAVVPLAILDQEEEATARYVKRLDKIGPFIYPTFLYLRDLSQFVDDQLNTKTFSGPLNLRRQD